MAGVDSAVAGVTENQPRFPLWAPRGAWTFVLTCDSEALSACPCVILPRWPQSTRDKGAATTDMFPRSLEAETQDQGGGRVGFSWGLAFLLCPPRSVGLSSDKRSVLLGWSSPCDLIAPSCLSGDRPPDAVSF